MTDEIEYLTNIVTPLLLHPEELKIDRSTDDRGILLTLSVNQEDMGKMIGKAGATAHSIRRLLRQFGADHKANIAMKINEPEGSTRPQQTSNDDNYDDL